MFNEFKIVRRWGDKNEDIPIPRMLSLPIITKCPDP
jgi:hypothetical protein